MKKTKKQQENTTSTLAENHDRAIRLLGETHAAMASLAAERATNKLSNSRVAGVARELGDLQKVMRVYREFA